MRFMTLSFLTAFLVIGASAATERNNPFEWKGPIAPGLAVEIRGLNGNVHAEFSSGTEVEVYADISSQVTDPGKVKVEVIHHDGGVTVCAVSLGVSPDSPKRCMLNSPGTGDARVNYTVRVPKGVGLIGRTVNGEVEAQGLQGDVSAETVNGKIQISTSGKARARTVNGNIIATVGTVCSMKSAALTTVNGSITLTTPSLANSALRAETTNGAITTDFPIAGHRRLISRRIGGRNGNASREIMLKTVNGSIQLRRVS
jgi:hypothetical protein